MKKLLLLFLSIGIIIVIFLVNQQNQEEFFLNLKREGKNECFFPVPAITYSLNSNENPKKERNKSIILYQGKDSKQKFIFTISVDKNISLPPPYLRRYHLVEGKINGNRFIFKIPKEIDDVEKLKISVQNVETNATITIDPSFLSDITTLAPNEQMKLFIDFDHPDDIEVNIEKQESLLPIPNQ